MEPFYIFLIINAFALGAALSLAGEHLWKHLQSRRHGLDIGADDNGVHISTAVKERLIRVAETDYQQALDASVGEFKGELIKTTTDINDKLTQLSGDILGEEMDRYKATLADLRAKAAEARERSQTDVERHQAELESLMTERQKALEAKFLERHTALEKQAEAEIMAVKTVYINQLDTRLADAVTSFLNDTLQYNADLGAQEPYLIAELEKHKTDLIREVAND